MAKLDQFYRIIAFIVLGVVVLCASVLYLRYREYFELATDADISTDDESEFVALDDEVSQGE